MATRGLIGFRVGGVDKLTYNHNDSYPAYLGKETLKFFREADPAKLAVVATKLKLVDGDKKPTKKQRETAVRYLPPGVEAQSGSDWADVLHGAEGKWDTWYTGLPFMMEYAGFIYSSSCEWVYVYDVDSQTLEIYSNTHEARGLDRYNHRDADGDIGARLLMAIPLRIVQALTDTQIEFVCSFIEVQDEGEWLERVDDDTLTQSSLLKGKPGQTSWCALDSGWEIQVGINRQYATCKLRSAGLELEANVADGLLLVHPGYGVALAELLDSQLREYAIAIYGHMATVAHYRKVMRFRNFIRKFDLAAEGLPLLAIVLEGNPWLKLRLTQNYFDQLKKSYVTRGLTNQGWKFLMSQPREVLCELVDTLEYNVSGMAFGVLQLNLVAAALQAEVLVCGRVKAAFDAVKRICKWGSWSSRDGVDNRATPVMRENAGIFVRVLMRATLTDAESKNIEHIANDVSDFVRSLDAPLPAVTWQSLQRRSDKWHQELQLVEIEKANATWESKLGVYPVGEFLALELNSAKQLMEEGFEMHHCVKSPLYRDDCMEGTCRVFSLRQNGARMFTVELRRGSEGQWEHGQVRGKYNSIITDSNMVAAAKRLADAYTGADARSDAVSKSDGQPSLF